MSCKSMETDVLARCSMDWKQVEIGLSPIFFHLDGPRTRKIYRGISTLFLSLH